MVIVWTNLAKITYFKIIEDLQEHWTEAEVLDFINRTNSFLNDIKNGLQIHRLINNEVRKCIIHKNISLYYIENKIKNEIVLITFYNNRMNPKTLLKLLK